MKRKQIIRDKFWSEQQPNNNLDFVEISLPESSVDAFIRKYAPSFLRHVSLKDKIRIHKKRGRLVKKILRAAALYFTNRQWQIFIHRWICSLKEVDIAEQLQVDQSYISSVLKACHTKLQKILGLKDKKYLRKQVHNPGKITSKRHVKKPTKKT